MSVEEVLEKCTVEGKVVKLPNIQLDRKEYLKVSEKLNLIGGKWKGGKVSGFVFDLDPSELLEKIKGKSDTNVKKNFQFFPTPEKIADYLVELALIKKNNSILEPSAGQGSLIKSIHKIFNVNVDCYELMDINQVFLRKLDNITLLGDDFLKASETKKYDRIIANPPFSKNQDIEHVMKMYSILEDGGRLVSVVSKHWQNSQNKKETEFKNFLKKVKAQIIELEEGEFKESGTMVQTLILIIDK